MVDDSDPENIIVKDKDNNQVNGIMYELAIEKVKNLNNFTNNLENLTAFDLEGTIDFSSLDKILNQNNTYYVNGNKLYQDSLFNLEVNFEYEIKEQKVIVGGESFSINAGEVDIVLKYLPLAISISEFTSNIGTKLTLEELKQDYGVVLPEYIYKNNENKTINEIEEIIDNVLIADVLGYSVVGEEVKNGEELVTGIMKIIAKKKVSELDNMQSIIEEQTVATLLDYSVIVDGGNTIVKDRQGNVITGMLSKIALYSIKEVDNVIDDLTLIDVFDKESLDDGAFKLLDQSTVEQIKISEISNKLEEAIKTSSINQLFDAGIISLSNEDQEKLSVKLDHDKDSSTNKKSVGELTIDELIDYCFDLIPVV